MDRNLIAQVTKLKGCIESAINSSDSNFIGVSFRKWLRTVGPVDSQLFAFEATAPILYILLTRPGLTPTNSSTRIPLSSNPSISLRKIGQLMSPNPDNCTGVNM